MNVGRVESCFTAIRPCPLWAWANQPYTGAAGVVVHFPLVVEEAFDIAISEKVWRAVRAIKYGNFRHAFGTFANSGG